MHIKINPKIPDPSSDNIEAAKLENPTSLGKKTFRIKVHESNPRFYIAAEKVKTGLSGLIQKIRHLFGITIKIEFAHNTYLVNKGSLFKRFGTSEKQSKQEQQNELQKKLEDVLSNPHSYDVNGTPPATKAKVANEASPILQPQPSVTKLSPRLIPQTTIDAQNRLTKAIIDIKKDIQTKKVDLSTIKDMGDGVSLTLLKGNIGDPKILKDVDAVVNAANATMYSQGGGTNAALTKAMGETLWNENLQIWKQNNPGRTQLDVSQAVTFEKPINTGKESGTLLIQALGPNISGIKDLNYETEGKKVYLAYKNIFLECSKHGVKSVLLPILSASIFAGKYQNDPRWKATIQEAIIKAIAEEMMDPGSTLKEFKIIDYGQYPFENTTLPEE